MKHQQRRKIVEMHLIPWEKVNPGNELEPHLITADWKDN